MSDAPLARRSWRSLTGAAPAHGTSAGVRARDGYTLRQRIWASFIGADLPAGDLPAEPVLLAEPPAEDHTLDERRQPLISGQGWFPLPRLSSAVGLAAAGSDTVLLEARSPDEKVQFLVRGQEDSGAGLNLELVVHDIDGAELLMTAVRYSRDGDGPERTLLVPVMPSRVGPAASYVRLPGFTGRDWTASAPIPVRAADTWDVATVTLSVRSALNRATRDAWRKARTLISDAGLRSVIDEELQ